MRASIHWTFVGDAELNYHNPILHSVDLTTRGRSIVLFESLRGYFTHRREFKRDLTPQGFKGLYERGVVATFGNSETLQYRNH